MSNGSQPGGSQPGGSQPIGSQPGEGAPSAPGGGGGYPGGVPGRKPLTRKISARSIVFALSGPEQPYPHYQFSGKQFFAKPNHNPFKGL